LGIQFAPDFPIFAISFSPDGNQLAVVADSVRTGGKKRGRLFIIATQHPDAGVNTFEVGAGIDNGEEGPIGVLGWSPSGNEIIAGGILLDILTKKTCEVPESSILIGDGRVIGRARADLAATVLSEGHSSSFVIFDKSCEVVGKWMVSEDWKILGVSPDGRLMLAARGTSKEVSEYLVINPHEEKIVRRWSNKEIPGIYDLLFANHGEDICGGASAGGPEKIGPQCWSVASGKSIGEARTVGGGAPIAAANRTNRLVVSDYQSRPMFLVAGETVEILKRSVVWDFSTGKEVLSWSPPSQTYQFSELRPPKLIKEPFRFGISPDGNFIVEGGNGVVKLYRIDP
jgi:hypothetical protein